MKKYSLLYFQQIDDKNSKWIFPLHTGENIIGSDKDVDIFLYLNNTKEDFIDLVHAKIILDEAKNKVTIINLSTKATVKILEKNIKISLTPLKEYELSDKGIFFLSENSKFILIKGTIEDIKSYFIKENIENEFNKWLQRITDIEKNLKINLNFNLNLSRKDSSFCNKSFMSSNNNNNFLNQNLNQNFNNFDEVPDFLALNNNNFSAKKSNNSFKFNNNNNFKEEINNNNDFYYTENNLLSSIKKSNNNDLINLKENKEILFDNINLENVFKLEETLNNDNNSNNNKLVKDNDTNEIIKELLGETNLEIINRNTDNNLIIEYDNFYKDIKNNRSNRKDINLNNIDIQLKVNNIENKIKKVKKK